MVGYDLNKPGQDYQKLYDKLRSYPNCWHHLDSTWLIKTNESAEKIRNDLGQLIDKNDELLVAALNGEAAWQGFNSEASKWLLDNIRPT
jgi:hypothetical protein